MTKERRIYQLIAALLLCLVQTTGIAVYGQDSPRAAAKRNQRPKTERTDSIQRPAPAIDSETVADTLATSDSITAENKRKLLEITTAPKLKEPDIPSDSLHQALTEKQWIPNPTKATWLALVIPGGGQIYNRKYWKLPIFYGGFAGCAYALTWNNKMYKDYMSAYKDAANGNFSSTSITDLLPPNYSYSESQLTELLRKRKDTYRRYRDMSIFAFVGVYLLSVVDAYVDAELSNFDIGPDLSMRLEPTVIGSQMTGSSSRSVGLQCSFRF